jgi:hypothetical protein
MGYELETAVKSFLDENKSQIFQKSPAQILEREISFY